MAGRIRRICFAASVGIVAIACGTSAPEATVEEPPTPPRTASFGESGEGGAPCRSDLECPEGFACEHLRIGEVEQKGCVQRKTDAGAKVDASSDATSDGGQTDDVPLPDAGTTDAGTTCTNGLSVTIASVLPDPRPKCQLNTTVDTSSPATLTYACDGGPASVTFGAQKFTGTDASGSVTLQNVNSYTMTNFDVTCAVDATQKITGVLASGTLQYEYTEVIRAGQNTLCPLLFLPCSATGPVAVQ